MYQVQKRDGKNVDFNLQKISDAIRMAFEAQEKQYHPSIIDFLALKVTADFEPKIKEGLISVEDIQDSVESVLVQAGYADVAKAYILYRRQREKLRSISSTALDYNVNGGQLPENQRLARQGKLHSHLFRRRTDPFQLRSDYGKLLALRSLR